MKELVGGVSIQMLSALCINLHCSSVTPYKASPYTQISKHKKHEDDLITAWQHVYGSPWHPPWFRLFAQPNQTNFSDIWVMSSQLWILTKKFIHNTSNFSFRVFLVVYWYRPSRCTYSHLQKFTTTQRVTIRMHTKLARPQLLLLPQKQLSWAWIDIWMSVSSKRHACFRNLF